MVDEALLLWVHRIGRHINGLLQSSFPDSPDVRLPAVSDLRALRDSQSLAAVIGYYLPRLVALEALTLSRGPLPQDVAARNFTFLRDAASRSVRCPLTPEDMWEQSPWIKELLRSWIAQLFLHLEEISPRRAHRPAAVRGLPRAPG